MAKLSQQSLIKIRPHRAPAQRAWSPKAADPGQPITWTRHQDGRRVRRDPSAPLGSMSGDYIWQPGTSEAMSGIVWSAGPEASSVWVKLADGAMVALKLPGTARAAAGELPREMPAYCATWQRDTLRRCEHLSRSAGIFAEVRTEVRHEYGRGNSEHEHTVAYHCDRVCPAISHGTRELYDWEPRVSGIVRVLLDASARGRSDLCRACIYLAEPEAAAEVAAAA